MDVTSARTIICSLEDVIFVEEGKKYPGRLDLFNDGCTFNGKINRNFTFNIVDVQIIKSTVRVSGFFGAKAKPGISIIGIDSDAKEFLIKEDEITVLVNSVLEEKYRIANDLLREATDYEQAKLAVQLFDNLGEYRRAVHKKSVAERKTYEFREKYYYDSCVLLDEAQLIDDAVSAKKHFLLLEYYKGSIEKVELAEKKITECSRKEYEYGIASKILASSLNVEQIEKAKYAFRVLSGYKDADQKVIECQNKIDWIHQDTYTKACDILANAKVANDAVSARDIFISLDEYRDSKKKIDECNRAEEEFNRKEHILTIAKERIKEACTLQQIDEAIEILLSINGYKDTEQYISISEKKKKQIEDRLYNEASFTLDQSNNVDELEKARQTFIDLDSYSDSSMKIVSCETKIREMEKWKNVSVAEIVTNELKCTEETDEILAQENRLGNSARAIWANPYHIIGISASSDKDERDSVADDIKQLQENNAICAYHPRYTLRYLPVPTRDYHVVLKALEQANHTSYQWLWFNSSDSCVCWKSHDYHEMLLKPVSDAEQYDIFLSCYLYALVFDPEFQNQIIWQPVLDFIEGVFEGKIVLAKQAVIDHVKRNSDESEVLNSFISSIVIPFNNIIDDADIAQLSGMCSILSDRCSRLFIDIYSKAFSLLEAKYESAVSTLNTSQNVANIEEAKTVLLSLSVYQFKDAEQKAKECQNRIDQLYLEAYTKACDLLANAKEAKDTVTARNIFSDLDDYNDSKNKIDECYKAEEEFNKKESVYIDAIKAIKEARTIQELDSIIDKLVQIDGYKDSHQLIEDCLSQKRQLQENLYVEACESLVQNRFLNNLEKAVQILSDLENARQIFTELGNYKDSVNNFFLCEKKITELKRWKNTAVANIIINICIQKKEQVYIEAGITLTQSNNTEELEEAKHTFIELDGYKDSVSKVNSCEIKIKEMEKWKNTSVADLVTRECTCSDETVVQGKTVKSALSILNNPYHILGISASSTKEEKVSVLNEIQLLLEDNTLDSYHPRFTLLHISAPIRDNNTVQEALTQTDNETYQWLWFNSYDACVCWEADDYHEMLLKPVVDAEQYDIFLSCYLYALVFDPEFQNQALWKPVLDFIEGVYENQISLAKQAVIDHVKWDCDESEILNSFLRSIVIPFDDIIKEASISQILRMHSLLSERCSKILVEYSNKALSVLETKYNYAIDTLVNSLSLKKIEEAKLTFVTLSDYKDARKKAVECQNKIDQLLQVDYTKACDILNNARDAKDTIVAREMFRKLKNYKDSKKKVEECRSAEAEFNRKEVIYSAVKQAFEGACTIQQIDSVLDMLDQIKGYKDSTQLIDKSMSKKEQIKSDQYIQASNFLDCGNNIEELEKAKHIFLDLNDYKDSASKVNSCEMKIKEIEKWQDITVAKVAAEELERPEETEKTLIHVKKSGKSAGCILENPYRILGIPASSGKNEINSVTDKIKKLQRLNAVASYRSHYTLRHLPVPARDLNTIQGAVTLTKDSSYKWLWFNKTDSCICWQSNDYHEMLMKPIADADQYDVFLSCYLYALVFDPEFRNMVIWQPVLDFIEDAIDNSTGLVKQALIDHLQGKQDETEIINSFSKAIVIPFDDIIKNASIPQITGLYSMLSGRRSQIFKEYCNKAFSAIVTWLEGHEKLISNILSVKGNDKTLTNEETERLENAINDFINAVHPQIAILRERIKGNKTREDIINDKFCDTLWTGILLLSRTNRQAALIHTRTVYSDFDDEHKRFARNYFGFVYIPMAERDATSHDWTVMGNLYMTGENGHVKNEEEAVKWFRRASDAGDIDAMNSLAIAYCDGKGVPKDYTEACTLFERAYKNGNMVACYNLALRYIHGEGVIQNDAKAEELLQIAANSGVNHAQELLTAIQRSKHRYAGLDYIHYDLDYVFIGYNEIKVVEVELNYAANVYLLEYYDYLSYQRRENFSYYGGRAYNSPYRIKIPYSGSWHVCIDDDDNDVSHLGASCSVRTIRDYY